jgi:TolB protein
VGAWPGSVVFAAEADPRARLDVFVQRRRDEAPRRLTRGRLDEFSPTWSPDGRTIAYRVNPRRGDEGDIWTMSATGRDKRNLTRSAGVADWSPAFSPDGARIAYMSGQGGAFELWLMDADGGGRRQLTDAGVLSEYPSWSPDGDSLAFSGVRGTGFDVLRIGADGSGEVALTRHPADDKWPAWSPDGRLIAFVSDRDGNEDVFVMAPDGSGARNLTRTPDIYENHPEWTADGRLTFLRHGERGPVEVRVIEVGAPGGADLPIDAVFRFDWTP